MFYVHIYNLSIDFIEANASSCINGAIRLNPLNESLLAPTQGLIEICITGRWNRTCSSNIQNSDARSLCRIMQIPSECKFNIMYQFNQSLFILSLSMFNEIILLYLSN